jgi:putative peptide zinc metalloprotease protein
MALSYKIDLGSATGDHGGAVGTLVPGGAAAPPGATVPAPPGGPRPGLPGGPPPGLPGGPPGPAAGTAGNGGPGVADPARPRLRTGIEIIPPAGPGERHVVCDPATGRYLRFGADAIRVLEALDGTRDLGRVAAALGPPFTDAVVAMLVARFAAAGLLETPGATPVRRRRLRYIRPITVQLDLVDPTRLLGMLGRLASPVLTPLGRRVATGAALALLALTLISLPVLIGALSAPVRPAVLLAVLGGLLFVTSLHELAHAAVLTAHGGRPSRIGVMLFYGAPAFFCDVTDAWRLPDRRKRVQVMLAGVAVNAAVAGSSAALCVVTRGDVRQGLALTALMNGVMVAVNLLPFVKFDGYLALMCHLDQPYLRDRAMGDARTALASVLFGRRAAAPRELGLRWSVPYGVGCMLLPPLLVAGAMRQYLPLLLAGGRVGAAVWLIAVGLFGLYLVSRWARLARPARERGVGAARAGAALAAVVAAAAAVLFGVHVPLSVPAGYEVRAGGVWVDVLDGASGAELRPGQAVELRTGGIVFTRPVGSAVVAGPPAQARVPVEAVLPLRDAGTSASVRSLPLTRVEIPPTAPGVGTARIRVGTVTLAEAAQARFVTPAWRVLAG